MNAEVRPLGELDDLLLRIRTLVREKTLLREAGRSSASLSAQSREIECLKSRLADLVRRNPTVNGTRRMAYRKL